eukprot:TRINITY_DN4843_c0_g1_i1.p1 TRINITY_DN4843_c0_g1~~TRINITY_DN4843_c0_g1_i1.p1  ORF type:complete len:326 (-),score=54.65 TRINITY_DN4843_c0_g1_i1:42-1019(-)
MKLCLPCTIVTFAVLLYPLISILLFKPIVDLEHFSQSSDYSEIDRVTTQKTVVVNGISLNVNEAGPQDAEKLIVFLHGFPETGYIAWKYQIPYFADHGYRVIAPDTRGTNTSTKGDVDVSNGLLAAKDVVELIKHYKYQKAFVVGHDWGAMVAWQAALKYPEYVEKLVIINVPHPACNMFFPEQMKRSWYIMFFQIPWISEWKVMKDEYEFLLAGFVTSNKNSYSIEDIERYKKSWNQPGSLTSMLNYYRHLVRNRSAYSRTNVTVPTLVLWGEKDVFLDKKFAVESMQFCDNAYYQYYSDASHWLPHDKPSAVNGDIETFIKEY